MNMPDPKRKKSPVDRFRNILSDGQKRDEPQDTRRPPVINLPRAKSSEASPEAGISASPRLPAAGSRSGNGGLLPVFWTTASLVSLVINIILIILLVTLLRGLGSLNVTGLGSGLLGGLYSNFERMDQAHIKTTIPVQTSIPLNMSIPVQTTTGITLAQDVTIPGAHVKINTALFNIDAPASVTLPAGTSLNVVLNFNVPVQTNVPVAMNIPVDIPLQDTDLHPAITGLQDTIKPLYCMISPMALSLDGSPVCR